MSQSTYIVTTATRPTQAQLARAAQVAARCGAPLVERRRGLRRHLSDEGAALAYVVGRHRDQLSNGEASLFVHAGLLEARLGSGLDHPLIRAVTGGRPARRLIDGTLGLAIDALHLAEATGAEVLAIEYAPAIRSLCEEGLRRLATRWPGAHRVRVWGGNTLDVLRMLPPDHADGVFLAPMFDEPAAAAPGWDLLRPLALHAPLTEDTVEQALRVAPRVAVKLSPADDVPTFLRGAEVVRSKALRYAVLSR